MIRALAIVLLAGCSPTGFVLEVTLVDGCPTYSAAGWYDHLDISFTPFAEPCGTDGGLHDKTHDALEVIVSGGTDASWGFVLPQTFDIVPPPGTSIVHIDGSAIGHGPKNMFNGSVARVVQDVCIDESMAAYERIQMPLALNCEPRDVNDLGPVADMAPPRDLKPPPDLRLLEDLAPPPDLHPPGDLAPPPDLRPPVDLAKKD
jgi:hypothetical protein